MNTGVIDRFTEVFTRYIDSGFGLLGGDVAFLASTLIAIDITLAGLFWAWGADEDVLAHLVKKTLYVGFFAFLIGNFNGLAKIVSNENDGLALLLPKLEQLVLEDQSRLGIERAKRLIHENDFGLIGEGADDVGALAHPA